MLEKFGLVLEYRFQENTVNAIVPFSDLTKSYFPDPLKPESGYLIAFDSFNSSLKHENGFYKFSYQDLTYSSTDQYFFCSIFYDIESPPKVPDPYFSSRINLIFFPDINKKDPRNYEILKNENNEPFNFDSEVWIDIS